MTAPISHQAYIRAMNRITRDNETLHRSEDHTYERLECDPMRTIDDFMIHQNADDTYFDGLHESMAEDEPEPIKYGIDMSSDIEAECQDYVLRSISNCWKYREPNEIHLFLHGAFMFNSYSYGVGEELAWLDSIIHYRKDEALVRIVDRAIEELE